MDSGEPPRPRARNTAKKRSKTKQVVAEMTSSKVTAQPPPPEPSIEPRLPPLEIVLYAVVAFGLLSTAFYNVYVSSQKHADNFGPYILEPGWLPLGNSYKDLSDFEWNYWTTLLTPSLVLMVLGHIGLGQVVQHFWPQFKKHFLLVYALACLAGLFSVGAVCVFTAYTVVAFLASRTKSMVFVWVVIILGILGFNVDIFAAHLRSHFSSEELYFHVIFGAAMCQCRLLSFSIEYCRHAQKVKAAGTHLHQSTSEAWGFFDIMVYNFYLPLFSSGPILTYDKFSAQVNLTPRPFTRDEILRILKEFARYIFWLLFAEIVLHFLYFSAFHQVQYVFQFLPIWTLAGVGLCHLLFFQVKYLVTYGLPRSIALWDRIEAPLPPICVLAMYMFRDMWKYFDRGLHSLLISTIYVPLGGSRHGLARQLLASMLCFAFVFYWHGLERHLCYWALINWLGMANEMVIMLGVERLGLDDFLRKWLSPSVYCRVLGVILTPNFMALALSNLVFLGGIEVAYVYYYRIIRDGWPWPFITTFTAFYCVLQVTKAAHQYYGKMYLCKKLYAS